MLDHQGAAGILSKLSDERKRGEAFPTIKISEQNETISLDVVPSSAIPSFFEIKEAGGGALFPKRIGSWVFEPRIDCKLERSKRTGESARIIFISG